VGEIDRLFVTVGSDIKGFLTGMTAVGDKASATQIKMSQLGSKMTKSLTLPLVGVGVAAVASAVSVEKGLNVIRIGTGATGEALEGMQDIMRNVSKEVPQGFEEVGTAVADLNTRLGLTGEPLEKMTKQMLDLARVTDTDVATVIRQTTRVFGDWGVAVEDQAGTLDLLFKTTQQTGIGLDALTERVVVYGAQLRGFGFSIEESTAMLGKFEKEGVNTEAILGSLKIGFARMAKEGITDAGEAMNALIQEVKDAPGDMDATAIALEVFGNRACGDFALAVREDRFEFDELMAAISEGEDTIEGAADDTLTLSDKFSMLKNQAALALEPLGIRMVDVLETLLPVFEKVGGAIATVFEWFGKLPEGAQTAAIAFAVILAAMGPVLSMSHKLAGSFAKISGLVKKMPGGFGTMGAALAVAVPLIIGLEDAITATSDAINAMEEGMDTMIGKWDEMGEAARRAQLEQLKAALIEVAHFLGEDSLEAQYLSGQINELERGFNSSIGVMREWTESFGQGFLDTVEVGSGSFNELLAKARGFGVDMAAANNDLHTEIIGQYKSQNEKLHLLAKAGIESFVEGKMAKWDEMGPENMEAMKTELFDIIANPGEYAEKGSGGIHSLLNEMAVRYGVDREGIKEIEDDIMSILGLPSIGGVASAAMIQYADVFKRELENLGGSVGRWYDNLKAALSGGITVNVRTETAEVMPHSGGLIMHEGGWIKAHAGLAPNEVPAILERGEHVTQKSSVTSNTLPVLQAINAGGDKALGGNGVNIRGNLILDFPNVTNEANAEGVVRAVTTRISQEAMLSRQVSGRG